MGAKFSAEQNTNIQEVFTESVNKFVSKNSQSCTASGAADAQFGIKHLTCEGELKIDTIIVNSNSKVGLSCMQSNISSASIKNFADTDLKNDLTKEASNIIGIDVSLDRNTTISRQIRKVTSAFKSTNFQECLATNLSTAKAIIENAKANGRCYVGDVNVKATSDIQMECIQKNTAVMEALDELNTSIQSELKTKKSSTGIVVMIIIGSIVALVIFIMIKKMKSSSPPMALPLQMPMMQQPMMQRQMAQRYY